MSRSPVRIGILGAARVAALSTIPHARGRDDVEIVAVASRDLGRAQQFAAEHGVPAAHGDYEDLLRRPDIDLVHVALPPALHAEWTLAALAEGKAVLCEKPFAMDVGQARQMVESAAARSLPLLEAFHYRFHPLFERALAIVQGGELGRLRRAEASFDAGVPEADGEFRWSPGLGGGALMDLGCYPLHLLRTLSGREPEVRLVRGVLRNGVDAEAEVVLSFPEGLEARMSTALAAKSFRAGLRLVGDDGELHIDNFVVPQLGARLGWGRLRTWREEPVSRRATFAFQLDHVVAVMRGATPLTGGADAIANMAALDAIRGRMRG